MYFIEIDLDRDFHTVTTEYVAIHDPRTFNDDIPVSTYNAVLDHGVNKAGTCSFTVPYNNPYINDLFMYQTVKVIRTKNSSRYVEWVGRVISIDKDLYLNKTVTCEGALSYLNDITMTPITYETECPLWWRLYYIMSDYCSKCSPKRNMGVVVEPEIRDRFGDLTFIQSIDRKTAYEEIQDILSNIEYTYVIDYAVEGYMTIMHLCQLPLINPEDLYEPQPITIDTNMLDYIETDAMDDICTRIYPIGKDGLTLTTADSNTNNNPNDNPNHGDDNVSSTGSGGTGSGSVSGGRSKTDPSYTDGGVDYVEDSTLIRKYGIIEKVISYENANSKEELRRLAEQDLWKYVNAEFSSFEISAFDLSLLKNDVETIRVGYGYGIRSGPHDVFGYYACTNAYIDIGNPANSKYKFDNLAIKSSSADYGYLTHQTSNKKKYQQEIPHEKPFRITKDSSNKVTQEFAKYKVVVEAEGEGNERYDFKRTIIGNEKPVQPTEA